MGLVLKLFFIQAVSSCVLGTVATALISLESGASVLIGGCLITIPQLLFGLWTFKAQGARNAHRIKKNLFVGEAVKIVLVSLGFVAAWRYLLWLDGAGLLAGFILTVMVHQIALPWIVSKQHIYQSG